MHWIRLPEHSEVGLAWADFSSREDQAKGKDRFILDAVRAYATEHSFKISESLAVVHKKGRRPVLRGADLHIGLSHSGHRTVLAIHPLAEIGVDLERRRDMEQFPDLEMFLTSEERDFVDQLSDRDKALAIHREWVRKESVVKALGFGLAIPLASFETLNQQECTVRDQIIQIENVALAPGWFCAFSVVKIAPIC